MRWVTGGGPFTDAAMSPAFSAVVGAQYSAAVEIYSQGITGGRVSADIAWFDQADNGVGFSARIVLLSTPAGWARYSRDGNSCGMACPTGATKGRMRVFLEGASTSANNILFRRVQVEKSPIIHDWQEGSNADALAAQVTTNAAAIATLQGKLAGAYWQVESSVAGVSAKLSVVATTSNGSTTSGVEIVAKQFTVRTGAGDKPLLSAFGSTLVISGDLVIEGSIVDGAVGAGKLGANTARYASANWTGIVRLGLGQSAQVSGFSAPLGVVQPKGKFLFTAYASIVNTSGPDVTGTYNGRPLYTHYLDDGGVTIYASDNEGHAYVVPLNGQSFQQVLATTAFNPTFIAVVRRGNTNTGIINQGDYYEQYISADYTLNGLSLNASWGAI